MSAACAQQLEHQLQPRGRQHAFRVQSAEQTLDHAAPKQQPAPVRSISWLSLLRLQSMREANPFMRQTANAFPTCEGALQLAMEQLRSRCKMHAVW